MKGCEHGCLRYPGDQTIFHRSRRCDAQRMAIHAALAKELAWPHDADYRFLPLLRYDNDLDPAYDRRNRSNSGVLPSTAAIRSRLCPSIAPLRIGPDRHCHARRSLPPVQRQAVGVFGHRNLGEKCLGWKAALDQARGVPQAERRHRGCDRRISGGASRSGGTFPASRPTASIHPRRSGPSPTLHTQGVFRAR